MADSESRCLDAFPEWLKSLADDARSVGAWLGDERLGAPSRQRLAGALSYLLKSVDLIQDGIEDLGYLDDACVLRVAAARAVALSGDPAAWDAGLLRLSEGAELVRELLGEHFSRLQADVERLATENLPDGFARELEQWAGSYAPPAWPRDPKNLVKFKSYVEHRLPAQ
jgi:uncharacterized membrane protein YkvA (DUF1232 family)